LLVACAGDRSEENLSDGQTQRLSLARGFLKDAEVIMMDEPTSGENLNVFFVRSLFTLRMMILPGQARDKHRESSTQRTNTGFLLQRWTLLLRGVLSTV
jgi:ABC-type lipopolysaccharide export system ATPase subunit